MNPAFQSALSTRRNSGVLGLIAKRAAGAWRGSFGIALFAPICLHLACAGPHVPIEPAESHAANVSVDVGDEGDGQTRPLKQDESTFLLASYGADDANASLMLEEVNEPAAAAEPPGAELGITADQFPEQGFRLLDTTPSAGRFPTGVAVARIGLTGDPCGDAARLRIERLRGVEAVPWNELLDDVPVVRETLLSGPVGLTPGAPAIVEIVRAAGHLRCGLCLTYVTWGDGKLKYGLKGVIWETIEGAPLATIRAAGEVALEDYEACIEEQKRHIDERPCRADTRAVVEFHQAVVAALIELIRQDRPATATQPSPWRGNLPLYPRDNRPILVTPRDRSEAR